EGPLPRLHRPGAVPPHRDPRQPLRALLRARWQQADLRRGGGGGQDRTPAAQEGGKRMSQLDLNAILGRLGLAAVNPGAWSGTSGWSKSTSDALINVRTPADGSLIAQVRPANGNDYEAVMSAAVAAAAAWRDVPAPKRGEAVRQLGEELRRHKQEL